MNYRLTVVMLNLDMPAFANSENPVHLVSEEVHWSGSVLFVIKDISNLDQIIWLVDI